MATSPSSRADFLSISRIDVPANLAAFAQEHLREAGRYGNEGFALWAGTRDGDLFTVEETIIPMQRGVRSGNGVCVTVDGEELFRINRHLHQTGRLLIAQIHSHPGEAYHSETDDTFPIATTAGALSIVVPDFAIRPFQLSDCAIYRLVPEQGWMHLSSSAVEKIIQLTKSVHREDLH